MKSSSTLAPNEPPILLVHGIVSPRVKRQRRETDYSPPFKAELKNGGNIPLLPIRLYFTLLYFSPLPTVYFTYTKFLRSNLHSRPHDWLSFYWHALSSYLMFPNLVRAGRPRDRSSSPGTVKNVLFSTSSRPVLVSTQPPIQLVPGALSTGVKGQGRETNHSLPASAEVKKIWIYTSTPPCLHGVVLN
jgi:hypothetical protein